MRFPCAMLLAGVVVGAAYGQDGGSRRWLQSQYPNLQKVSVQKMLHDARAAGLLTTPQQELTAKQEFRRLRGKDRSALPQYKRVEYPKVAVTLPTFGIDNAVEHETNDGWQYADRMLAETVASGDCTALNDVDSWQFDSTGGFYTVAVNAAGVGSIADSILHVRNQKGDPVAFNDDAGASLLSQIHVYLPAGTYYADVSSHNGTGGGLYDLSVTSDPVTLVDLGAAPVAAGVTQTPAAGIAHDVFRFSLAGDSRVSLSVGSLGSDTTLVVQRSDGVIVFANDDSAAGGADAAADIDLPAGDYVAYVAEIGAAAGVAFQVTYAATAITIPDLCAAGSMTGLLNGDESLRLARVDLLTAQNVDLMTSDGPVSPVQDTVLSLWDRDLDYLCDVDDDDPFGTFDPSRGFYSRINMSLPAGVYYAAVVPFTGAVGDVTLAATCSAPAPDGVANFGLFTGAIQGFGDIATYQLDNCSQASTRVMGGDFFFGLLDKDGELMTCTSCAPFWPQAGEVRDGASTLFIWDRYDFSGLLATELVPPLYDDAGTPTSRAKEGDLVFLFARFGRLTSQFNFGVGDRGWLCLRTDLYLVTYATQVAPVDGIVTWPGLPTTPLGGLKLQQGDLHFPTGWNGGLPAVATWRNMISR